MEFSEDQINRYARHILLPQVGGLGQAKLLESRVLLVGAGGLGSPLGQYLAAAGVGIIGLVDDDAVDLSNLQRQILHFTDRIGLSKVESAKQTIAMLNPDVTVIPHEMRLSPDNVEALIADYDIIADGSDNFPTRYLLHDACFLAKKTLVSAAVMRFDGQLSTYKAHESGPCLRCLFREAPPSGQIPSCAEAGVLGAVAGVMGTLQATEVLKELLGLGQSMSGHLLIHDALEAETRKVKVSKDPSCPLCGENPSLTDLSHHAAWPRS